MPFIFWWDCSKGQAALVACWMTRECGWEKPAHLILTYVVVARKPTIFLLNSSFNNAEYDDRIEISLCPNICDQRRLFWVVISHQCLSLKVIQTFLWFLFPLPTHPLLRVLVWSIVVVLIVQIVSFLSVFKPDLRTWVVVYAYILEVCVRSVASRTHNLVSGTIIWIL